MWPVVIAGNKIRWPNWRRRVPSSLTTFSYSSKPLLLNLTRLKYIFSIRSFQSEALSRFKHTNGRCTQPTADLFFFSYFGNISTPFSFLFFLSTCLLILFGFKYIKIYRTRYIYINTSYSTFVTVAFVITRNSFLCACVRARICAENFLLRESQSDRAM